MDISILNDILTFADSKYSVSALYRESGQRKVYFAKESGFETQTILKICPLIPTNVSRIKKEIGILQSLRSEYFPKFYFEFYVTNETITYFIDSFDPKINQARIDQLNVMKIAPFLVTVEEFIENKPWIDCQLELKKETNIIDLLIHIFNGLKLLWDKKIVHRDLKPENILLRPNLHPVIIDLGIAKSLREGTLAHTNPGIRSPCTPAFAAPEQLLDMKAEITYKTDQFSVGVVSYLALTGQFPFGNFNEIGFEGLVKNMQIGRIEDIRSYNSSISVALVQLIERLLRYFPYQRYRNVEEILHQLNEIKRQT